MQSNNGDIQLSVSLSPTDVKQSAKELQNEIKKVFDENAGKNLTAQMQRVQTAMSNTATKVKDLSAKMASLENQKIPTDEYKEVQKQIDQTQTRLNKLQEIFDRVAEGAQKVSPSKLQQMRYETAELENTLEYARGELQELVDSGRAFTLGSDTGQYQKLTSQLANVNNQARMQLSTWDQLTEHEHDNESQSARLRNALSKLGSALSNLAKSGIKGLGKIFKSLSSATKNLAGSVANLAGRGFKKLTPQINSSNISMKKGIMTILKYGLGIRSLYALMNKLKSAGKEAFKALAQQSSEVNKDLSNITNAFEQAKNSIATAFQPILSVVAPVLVKIANLATQAATAVGKFFATLTGQNYIYKATSATRDYASSVADSTKATKENTKAQKDEIGAYDNLQVIQQDTADNADKATSGGDTGAGGFEMEQIDPSDSVSKFAQLVKDAWEKADFTEVGTTLGQKLKNTLDNIPWDSIKESANKIGKSIGTFINGFVEVPGLGTTIGKTIGEGINTALSLWEGFVDNTHFDSIGRFIGDGLQGAIDTIDWKKLGTNIGKSINGVFDIIGGIAEKWDGSSLGTNLATSVNKAIGSIDWKKNGTKLSNLAKDVLDAIISFLEKTNWQKLGEGIADFIGGIDWSGLMQRLSEGIGAALGGLVALLWGLIKNAWDSVIAYWKDAAFEDGQFTIMGLLNGIWEGIKGIATWIYNNIFVPFINGFKKAFGIASPSTVMIEMGGYIIQGLINGISALISTVVELFKNLWSNIQNVFANVASWFKTKFASAFSGIKNAWSGVKSFFNNIFSGIKNIFSSIHTWFKTKFASAFSGIKNAFSLSAVKSYFNSMWSNIKGVFGNVTSWFKNTFSKAWSAVKNVFSSGGKVFTGIKDGILNGLKSVINTLISGINKIIKVPFDGLNTALGKLKAVKIGALTPFSFLPTLSVPQIPKLAQGAVIPPNKEFLAMLGDQKQGTNIEAPLDTIKQALVEVMSNRDNINMPESINVYLPNGKVLAQAVWDEENKYYKQTGRVRPGMA